MRKNILAILTFSLLFILAGCGSNSKPDGDVSVPEEPIAVTMQNKYIVQDDSGVNFTLAIPIVKKLDSAYHVELSGYGLTVAGCNVNSIGFAPPVLNLDGGYDSIETLYVTGTFDANCTITGYTFTATQTVTKDSDSDTRAFSATFNYSGGGGVTPPPASGYSFYNATTPLVITEANTAYDLKVQLLNDGFMAEGETVKMKAFPAGYGDVSNGTVTTGTDGYANFAYTSPKILPLNGLVTDVITIVFEDENNQTLEQKISLDFQSATGGGTQYSLTNVTTPIEVNYDDELKNISVDVVDQNGVGIEGQDVSITAVSGVENGAIVSASVTKSDISGHTIFTYKAPSDVTAVDGTTTTVTLSMVNNGVTISEDVNITFKKVDVNVSIPIVSILNINKEINLTSSSQHVEMEVQVFEEGTNTPYTTGNVKVTLPSSVLDGTDVGSFTEYIVPVGTNGKATFNYTGPQDLKALVDAGETNATFGFHHEENPTNIESITVVYDLTDKYIPANYILTTSSSDGNQTMGLKSMKTFTLYLKDDKGNVVPDQNITQIVIESKNTLIGKLVDTANNGTEVSVLTLSGNAAVNSKSFPVQTYKSSGLLPIEITVDFNDANNNPKSLTINMSIVVFSGPPTSMSISYAGVEQNSTIAKYIEKFVVTVTDAYNNPVNTRPYVAVGGMVEYAIDGSSVAGERNTTSPRLWHGLNDSHGDLVAIGGDKAQFEAEAGQNIFQYVDYDNDKLVVFGAGFVYEALGKWDIFSNTNDVLGLVDDYFGTDRTSLYYAVGHNNRQDLCAADGREYVGNMKANTYQLDDGGHALIEFEYDYHLTGKDIMVWVNLTGFQADNGTSGKIGEAKKHTLRGNGFVSPQTWLIAAGSAPHSVPFTVEHENAPEKYRNGHFGFAVTGKCAVHGILDWSNNHDARECDNTIGYVDLNVSNPSGDDCTITIDRINVSPEFNGVTTY